MSRLSQASLDGRGHVIWAGEERCFEPIADGRNRSRNYPARLEAEPVEEAVPAHVGVRPDIHPFERQGQ